MGKALKLIIFLGMSLLISCVPMTPEELQAKVIKLEKENKERKHLY